MMHHHSKQFGKRFEMRLAELVQRIVTAVDNKLPISPIEKVGLVMLMMIIIIILIIIIIIIISRI